jgi:hypothetical protein
MTRRATVELFDPASTPETSLCQREITGNYAIKIVINRAYSWNQDRKGGRNLWYKPSQKKSKSMNLNA